jgi:hypothetical protein
MGGECKLNLKYSRESIVKAYFKYSNKNVGFHKRLEISQESESSSDN